MRRLVIVSGISGAGKSYMYEQLADRSQEFVPLPKLSTRTARPYENDADAEYDIIFEKTKKEVSVCRYKYNYFGNVYGIDKKDIDRALALGKSPFVIVRSSETIRDMKDDYPNALVIYIKSAYTGSDLKKILKAQGRSDIDIEERMKRHHEDLLDYSRNIELYDYVFTNLYDDDSLISQFDNAVRLEKHKYPIDHDLVFVLMSFNKRLDHIFEEVVDAAKIANESINVVRIDKIPSTATNTGTFPISQEILNHIERANLIICDLSEERPNVYYELGYARGKGKPVIHCASKDTELHFDVRDFHTIIYDTPTDLRKKLIPEFQAVFNHEY